MRKQIEENHRMEIGKFILFMVIFFTITTIILLLSNEKDDFKPLNLDSKEIKNDRNY